MLAVSVQQLWGGMKTRLAAGRLQLVIQRQSNAWPGGANTWTGQWHDRAVRTLLVVAEQRHGDASSMQHCSRAHNTGRRQDTAEHIRQGRAHKARAERIQQGRVRTWQS